MPDLPPEIIHCIVSFISGDHQRRHNRLINSTWFEAINYNEFRIGALLASEADEFYRIFSRYTKPIHLKFMKTDYLNNTRSSSLYIPVPQKLISAPLLEERLCRKLTQLTGLDLHFNSYLLRNELLSLQYMTTLASLSDSRLMQMTNLKRLKANRIFISNANQTMKLPLNLESIEFEQFSEQPQTIEINTHLTELKVSEVNVGLLKAFPNLKSLKMNAESFCDHYELRVQYLQFPNLEELDTYATVRNLSGLPNLTKLCMRNSPKLTPAHTKLKIVQCFDRIRFPENHQSLLQSLESCKVFSSDYNPTIINFSHSQLQPYSSRSFSC